jgi:hypothetical protein
MTPAQWTGDASLGQPVFKRKGKKMRKLFIVLTVLALLGFGTVAMANPQGGGGLGELKTYVSVNNTSTNAATLASTAALGTGVVPGKSQILGYRVNSITPTGIAGECVAALVDVAATTSLQADASIMSEIEDPNGIATSDIFPMPMNLANGLVIRQGAYTIVTVYYVNTIG